jgi:hypothetical protein
MTELAGFSFDGTKAAITYIVGAVHLMLFGD